MNWILYIGAAKTSNPSQKLIYRVLTISKPRTNKCLKISSRFLPFMFRSSCFSLTMSFCHKTRQSLKQNMYHFQRPLAPVLVVYEYNSVQSWSTWISLVLFHLMLCYVVHIGTIKCVCINVCVWMNNVDMSFQLDDTTTNRTEKTLPVDGSIVFPIS